MAPVTSSTASPASSRSAIWAAWAVLIGMGGTEMVYNIWHAIFTGHMHWGLALLYGLAPVAAAVLLSHIVAEHDGGWFLQGATFAVMLSAMALSAYATASVTKPAAGTWFAWVFGLTLDAAALLALNVIFSSRKRKAAAAAAAETERAEVAGAAVRAAEAERKFAGVTAELEIVKAELEAERQKVPPRNRRRGSARKPARTTARNLVPASVPEPPGSSAPEDMPDLDAEARILHYIEQGHSASQAGILAGKSDSYGRQVARLAKAARQEPAGTERAEGDMS